MPDYRRPHGETLSVRLQEPRRFLQVITGARQVGKTTLVRQVTSDLSHPVRYASADEPTLRDREWITQQWEASRLDTTGGEAILVLDEVQKVSGWSETVKRLWDEDTAKRVPLKVVLLGSAPLLMHRGPGESLAGRFELTHLPHWSLTEMEEAFGWDAERFIFFGGYPGATPLVGDPGRWAAYIRDSLIETTISRDVLLLTRVDKPALLRRLFELGCAYSGQILSYNKMLGQLHDAGNTTTLAGYLELLGAAGMLTGLQKYSGRKVRQRASSPKLQVLNTALMTAQAGLTPEEARSDPEFYGRLVESAVGAHLANAAAAGKIGLYYWREGNKEVDFVVRRGGDLVTIEVKSGRRRVRGGAGTAAFRKAYEESRPLLVGGDGIPVEEFLKTDPLDLVEGAGVEGDGS